MMISNPCNTDAEAKSEIEAWMNGDHLRNLQYLDKEKRNPILRKIKGSEGVSLRQIARIKRLIQHMVLKTD